MIHHSIFLALLVGTFGGAANAQVFKCTDQHGRNTFSDKPCRSTDKAAIAHQGLTPAQAMNQELQHQQALEEKAMRQGTAMDYGQPAPGSGSVYTTPRNTSAQRATGPGKSATISRLLPSGAGFSDREAARQQARQERQARQTPSPSPPAPTDMTRCAGGFCQDNQGGVYHRHGNGMMTGPSGQSCRTVGNMVYCN